MVQDRAKVSQEQDISRPTGCGNTSVYRLVEDVAQRGHDGDVDGLGQSLSFTRISRLTGCENTSVCRLVEDFVQRGYDGAVNGLGQR